VPRESITHDDPDTATSLTRMVKEREQGAAYGYAKVLGYPKPAARDPG
jgi:hypothetical protein